MGGDGAGTGVSGTLNNLPSCISKMFPSDDEIAVISADPVTCSTVILVKPSPDVTSKSSPTMFQ